MGDAFEADDALLGAGVKELAFERQGRVGRLGANRPVFGGEAEPLQALAGAVLEQVLGDVGERPCVLGEGAVEPGGPGEDQSPDAVGVAQGRVQGDRRAHRDPADDRAVDPQVVEQRDEVVGERGDRDRVDVAERPGLAVRRASKPIRRTPRRRRVQAERLRDVAPQAVLEDERQALAPCRGNGSSGRRARRMASVGPRPP